MKCDICRIEWDGKYPPNGVVNGVGYRLCEDCYKILSGIPYTVQRTYILGEALKVLAARVREHDGDCLEDMDYMTDKII